MVDQSIELKKNRPAPYQHAAWATRRRFLRFLVKTIGFNLLARLDHVEGLEQVPAQGAAILMINHIAFIDSIVVLSVLERDIVPLAKAEVYDYPLIGIFPHLWGVIPVRREEFDRRAILSMLEVLRAGEMILVAPEGTRHNELHEGKEGIAFLASRTATPIVPVSVEGTPGFPALRFTRRWREPGVSIRFGRPFRYRPEYQRPGRQALRKMTDEAMYALASLLAPQRRGIYSDLALATQDTIEWL